MSDTNCL